MASISQTFPIVPMSSLPAFIAAGAAKYPQYAGLPVFPGMPVQSFPKALATSAFMPPPKALERIIYSQSEIDMLLYGYTKSKMPGASHALSGLGLSDIKYGLDKIGPSTSKSQSLSLDKSTLPEGINIQHLTFAGMQHSSAFTTKAFDKGHMFGPFQGKNVYTSEIKTNDGNSAMWEIFKDGELKYFIDGRGAAGNWMSCVNCARYNQEQNLDAIQIGEKIFYQASRDIPEGKELLVWYGDTYAMDMGIPLGLKAGGTITEETKQSVMDEANNSTGYSCERCGKVFAYKYYKDKHLKYTRCVDQGDRKFPCTLCTRSFEKRDRLRIHILHVHEKHRPHKCSVCSKCFSQSSSLNKHMRVHSGERPYKCVYCNKAFTASSILRTHIRQHSGEKPFKCKFCGKAFASHAAHDSHVRRTHAKDKIGLLYPCGICKQSFDQELQLTFHMNTHHKQKGSDYLKCGTCDNYFHTMHDLYYHSTTCLASPQAASPQSTMTSVIYDDGYVTGGTPGKKEDIDVVG